MNLSDLFAVYNEVSPDFRPTPKRSKVTFYNPLQQITTVRKALQKDEESDNSNDTVAESPFTTTFSWNYSNTTPKEVNQEDIQIPYREGYTKPYKDLVQYLKDKEKFVATKYQDSGGVWTIGYGFTDPEIVKKGTITEQEAEQVLLKDIEDRRTKLKSQIKTWDKLNENQQNALISYGFNVGVGNWSKTQPKLLKALNEERFAEAAQYINAVKDKKGNTLPGLVKRRKEERDWFNA